MARHLFSGQISCIFRLGQQSFRSGMEPLLLQILNPRDKRVIVLEEKFV